MASTLRWTLRHSGLVLIVFGRGAWWRSVTSTRWSRRVSFRGRTLVSSSATRGRAKASPSTRWSDTSSRSRDIIQKNPNVEAVMSTAGQGTGGVVGDNVGTLHHPPEAACSERTATADEVIQEIRQRGLAGCRACGCFCPIRRRSASAARCRTSDYVFTLTGPELRALYGPAQELEEQAARRCRILQDVSTNLELRNPEIQISILRDQASALGITSQQIETGALQRVRRAPGQHAVRRGGPVSGDARARPALPGATSMPWNRCSSRVPAARWCRSARVARSEKRRGPGFGRALRAAAVGHAVLQPRAGRLGRRCRDRRSGALPTRCRRPASGPPSRAARRRSRRLSGRCRCCC